MTSVRVLARLHNGSIITDSRTSCKFLFIDECHRTADEFLRQVSTKSSSSNSQAIPAPNLYCRSLTSFGKQANFPYRNRRFFAKFDLIFHHSSPTKNFKSLSTLQNVGQNRASPKSSARLSRRNVPHLSNLLRFRVRDSNIEGANLIPKMHHDY